MAEPADLSRVYDALRKADAAGNTADAKRLADYIRSVRAQSVTPEVTPAPADEGLMGHLRGALRSAAAEREPGLMRSFLELAALPPGEGPLAAAVHRAGDVTPGAQQLAAAAQAGLTDQNYAEARREQEARVQAGQAAHPVASGAGAGAAVIAQLGGPMGVARLAAASPQMLRALVSRGMLTKEAILGALRGAGVGAGVGAALSDADIPLAEGDTEAAGQQALAAATDPTALALGATLGAGAGAAKSNLATRAASKSADAAKLEELHRVQLEEAARPAKLEAAKAEAVAATRRPTPENATRWFGLDRLTGRTAAASKARAVRLMTEPVPEIQPGKTDVPLSSPGQPTTTVAAGGKGAVPTGSWMAARQHFGDDVSGWQQYVNTVKTGLGERLGEIRSDLHLTGAVTDAKALKEKLQAAAGPLPTERTEKVLGKALSMVDDAAKQGGVDTGVVSAEKLRQIIKNLEEGKAWRLRGAAVDVEKRLIAEHLPESNGEYRRLLGQWGDANELALGAEGQFRAQNKGSAPVRFDKPAPVDVPEPQFAGGPEARREAEALLEEFLTPMQKLERAAIRSAGGAVGGALGAMTGLPYAGYGGAASGYQGGQALAEQWVKATRPTIGGVINDAVTARRALARWGPQMQAALRRGPTAVRSLHRALSQADPDYRDMMENTGRSAPEPLDFGSFSNAWRRGR